MNFEIAYDQWHRFFIVKFAEAPIEAITIRIFSLMEVIIHQFSKNEIQFSELKLYHDEELGEGKIITIHIESHIINNLLNKKLNLEDIGIKKDDYFFFENKKSCYDFYIFDNLHKMANFIKTLGGL